MIRIASLFAALLCVQGIFAQVDTLRVLFLGNSYTASNGLPSVVSALAADLGTTVVWQANTPGGATLQGHTGNASSLALIEAENWDFVVLQEQSQLPSFPNNQVQTDFFPAVESLVNTIRYSHPCAVPLLFMTWGRENGDASNCANWPPVCTYEGMQELLTQRYLEAADLTEAWCAPVGRIWQELRETTDLALYQPDGSHPSAVGTYVAASTLAVAMLGVDPSAAEYGGNIDAADRALIDAAVWSAWQVQPDLWRQYAFTDFDLAFELEPGGATVHVTANPYLDSVVVDTGVESFTFEDELPQFIAFEASTTWTATAYGPCAPAESSTFQVEPSAVASNEGALALYPNPADGYTTLAGLRAGTAVELCDLKGGVVLREQVTSESVRIQTGDLPAGWYAVRGVGTEGAVRVLPLLVEH